MGLGAFGRIVDKLVSLHPPRNASQAALAGLKARWDGARFLSFSPAPEAKAAAYVLLAIKAPAPLRCLGVSVRLVSS